MTAGFTVGDIMSPTWCPGCGRHPAEPGLLVGDAFQGGAGEMGAAVVAAIP